MPAGQIVSHFILLYATPAHELPAAMFMRFYTLAHEVLHFVCGRITFCLFLVTNFTLGMVPLFCILYDLGNATGVGQSS